jgi:hypothetical protein
MSLERHDIQWENVAPYVLGALTDAEVVGFERHLEECPVCRDEADRLRPAADALPRSVQPLAAPPSLKQSLMAVVEAEAREAGGERARPGRVARLRERLSAARLRPRAALAGVSLALLLGALAGYGITQVTSDEESRTIAAAVDKSRIPSGSGRLEVPADEGDNAVLRVNGMPALRRGRTYQVWVLRDGAPVPQKSLFTVGEDGQGSAVVTDDLKGAQAVLVTREPAGGARAPSEKPILSVEL